MKRSTIAVMLSAVYPFLVLAPCAWAQDKRAVTNVEAITARMAQARLKNRTSFRLYTITRDDYSIKGSEFQTDTLPSPALR